ncbi:MAG: outer membrane protein assembly factor BamA [Nitrospiraceae bacterium]|nr:MAG: outer membrane protein assembly factor BamA [Nitrospiraceae bacterium]
MHKTRLLLSVIIIFIMVYTAYAQRVPFITAIEIQGLKRIEEGAIRAKISQSIGGPVSQEQTNEDIKSIFRMGYFDDVRVEIEAFEGGAKLIYIVKEKPVIVTVAFEGNEEVDDEKLSEKITIAPGSIADTVLIQDNATRIKYHYEEEGYWLSNIVPVINTISEDEVSLTFQIDEGKKIRIKDIIIEGNNAISSRKIKKVMDTKEWWIFSFISSSGYHKSAQLENDMQKIKNLYFDHGYIKAIVAEPDLSVDKEENKMTIKVRVAEGEQFSVASIAVQGNTVFDNDTIKSRIALLPGDIFSKASLEKDMASISEIYSENGYALVSVVPDLVTDDDVRSTAVTLIINEGDRFNIGRIEISGNTKTRDKVIRREVRINEGETYNGKKITRSYDRINNLNFFESVQMVPKPRSEEKIVDLEVKVKERQTGFLSVGGGYSSLDGFVGTVEITQGNLFGKGQYLKLKGELGGESNFYELSFKDPWIFDRPISFSTGIYRSEREYIEYDKEAKGGYIGFGRNFGEYWRGNVSYRYERATIENVDDDASIIIKDQEGTNTVSSITPSLVRDSRNNFIDPTAGSRNSIVVTYAGLGGSLSFIKGTIDSGWYFPIGRFTFMVRGRFGYARGISDDELPLYERFYVGGIYTVRGLEWGDAGPKDPLTGDEIGGTEQLIFNTEFIFPIVSDLKLKGVIFFDAGNAYDEFEDFGELRYTAGVGVRWISPMGPIRLEWGYNIDKEPDEDSSRLEIAFGSFF